MFKKKKYGQVFATAGLIKIISSKIKDDIRGKIVLEIGPGEGKLTEKILEFEPKKLIAVEKDFEYFQFLKNRFADKENFECVNADILEYKPKKIDVAIGNVPYYISSDLLVKMRSWKFQKGFLTFQKEFAERLTTPYGNKNYSRLAVTSQHFFETEIIKSLSKKLFSPIPKVDSALISIKPKKQLPMKKCEEELLNLIFTNKKQKLKKAIHHVLNEKSENMFSILTSCYGVNILDERVFKIDGEKIIKACKLYCEKYKQPSILG
ncbi:ribosomal RNA small subunit methyltransferase A [Candidatus Micrarchaeota archaeon]|jgi:16S rRNA (adenine1518-N6/adenine1519-N6)-dimethyltransferase|nr:ribosomal RNA small subunit methyltransferase A [Candidatus Micrarchaeota archaeon]